MTPIRLERNIENGWR